MSPFVSSLFLLFHTIPIIVFVGYFLTMALIVIPPLAKAGQGQALSLISKQSRSWLYASAAVFIVTGTGLMLFDPAYLGFMNFGNIWGTSMLAKHLVILVMVVLGFWFNAVQRVGPKMNTTHETAQAIRRFSNYVNLMTLGGFLVLVLTAIAEIQ